MFIFLTMTFLFFFFQAEDGIRDLIVTGVQTCALPIFDGQKTIAKIKNGDFAPSDTHGTSFAQRDILHFRNTHPLFVAAHACTFSSGSIWTNCVGWRGVSPSSQASCDSRLDLRYLSRKPC